MEPDDLEAVLLGAPCELTRDEVAAAVGIPEPEARSLWNAMGFPDVGPDERAFTHKDVEALRTALAVAESGLVDADTVLVLARAMGQELARTAEAHDEVDPLTPAHGADATPAARIRHTAP